MLLVFRFYFRKILQSVNKFIQTKFQDVTRNLRFGANLQKRRRRKKETKIAFAKSIFKLTSYGIGSIQYFTKEFMATQRVINVYLYLVRMQSCRKKEEEKNLRLPPQLFLNIPPMQIIIKPRGLRYYLPFPRLRPIKSTCQSLMEK